MNTAENHKAGKPVSANPDQSTNVDEEYLTIRKVSKQFGDFTAVNSVDLTIKKGEIFALLGASGCGKSTLLRMLAGFETPTSGDIILQGERINDNEPFERPINMMFQSYALFPHMTVEQNLAFGLKQDKLEKSQIAEKVDNMLSLVQMQHLRKRRPHQLSGGQQQRVALARSLIKSPKLLLLDEPMGALDKKLRARMQLEIANIIESLGVTCVMVTHDQEEAMTMADRIAIMDAGEICQVGTPSEIYEQPNSQFTAEFIGSVNILKGAVKDDEPSYVTIASDDCDTEIYIGHGITCFVGQEVAVALRPEKISISKTKPDQQYNCIAGVIKDIAYFGSHSVYHVRTTSGKTISVTEMNDIRWASDRLTWEDPVWVYWDDNASVVLTE